MVFVKNEMVVYEHKGFTNVLQKTNAPSISVINVSQPILVLKNVVTIIKMMTQSGLKDEL